MFITRIIPAVSKVTKVILYEKPTFIHLAKKFPIFYGIQNFITVFTRANHWILPLAR